MKISCIIGPYFPVPPILGGAVEKIFLALCEQFAAQGHDVIMISRRYPGFPNSETSNGVRHIRVRSRDRPASRLAYRFFDILYALRARVALPPSEITITNSVSMPLFLSRRKAGKIYVDVARYPKGQMGVYRRADRLQACSEAIAKAVCEQSPSVAHLVKVIPNAITSRFADAARSPRERDRAKEILYVGRVAREKGIDLLIQAFAELGNLGTDWRLSVIGPWTEQQGGDGEDFLDELKAKVPVGCSVDFIGPIFDEEKLVERYRSAAIFVYPSVAEQGESFGLAPVEAMACGCAPIVSQLDCFREFLKPEYNGLTFNHRDPNASSLLARSMVRLIQSPELRDKIAEAAQETSRDYTPECIARLFLADFAELLDKTAVENHAASRIVAS